MTDTVTFLGRDFHVASKVGLMPLLKFAKSAQSGMDSSDMDGMAAMYDLLQQCIADEEWADFEAHATKERADDEDLLALVQEALSLLSERQRPTKPSSDSSTGLQSTPTRLEGGLHSRVISRLEKQGRPDLALIVANAERARAA